VAPILTHRGRFGGRAPAAGRDTDARGRRFATPAADAAGTMQA
jgi:hypothetical protein